MNELENLHGQAGVVGFSRSVYVASVFILNIGLARGMGPEVFGSFQQVFIFNAVFLILTLGIPETIYYFLPRLAGEEKPRFFGQTFQVLTFAGLATVVLFWFCAPLFSRMQHNTSIVPALRAFGVYGAFIVASSFTEPVFIAYRRLNFLFFVYVFHAVFLCGLTVWYYVSHCTPQTLFVSMAVFGFLRYVLAMSLLLRMRREIGGIRFFGGKGTLAIQMSFALPIVLSTTTDIVSRWLDKYVVSFFFGPEALGVFFVGAIEIPFIGVIVSSVFSVVSPVLNSLHHENDFSGFAKLVSNTFIFLAKIVWPVFFYLFVFADHIIPLVFKEEFEGAVLPFRIYLLLVPLRIAVYGVIVVALSRPRVVLQCALLALMANFVLNIVLALQLGFVGPAIATVVSTYLHVVMLMYIILRELRVPFENVVPVKFLSMIGSTCAFSALLSYGLTYNVSSDFEAVGFSLLIYSTAYLFIGTKIGLIRISDYLDLVEVAFFGKGTGGTKG